MLRPAHRTIGLIIALPVLLQAATGTLLVFEPEIDRWLNGDQFYVEPTGTRLSVQAQFDAFSASKPEMERHVYIMRLPAAADEATVMLAKPYNEIGPRRGVRFFLDPYSGDVGDGQPYHTTLMGKVYNLHRTFWLPRWGRWITSTSAVLTATLAVSGLMLAIWPKAHNADLTESRWLRLHRRLGVGMAPLVAVIALNGAAVTYMFVILPLLYLVTGTEMPREMREGRSTAFEEVDTADRKSLDELIAAANQEHPAAEPRVLLQPSVKGKAVTVVLRKPHEARSEGGTMIVMNPQSGLPFGTTDFTDGDLGHQAVYWLIHLHKGTWGGIYWGDRGKLATRILWVIVAASATILAATGAGAWCKRRATGAQRARLGKLGPAARAHLNA